jgi:hypothetical protein
MCDAIALRDQTNFKNHHSFLEGIMSQGSESSGADLVAGRTNRAERRTIFWADVAPGEPNYTGPAILMVDVAKDLENSDWDTSDYEDARLSNRLIK